MNDFEKIMAMYPQLEFYSITVDSPDYSGHIDGKTVFVNELQPDPEKLLTMIHEAEHAQLNNGDLTQLDYHAKLNEKDIRRFADKDFKIIFGMDCEEYTYRLNNDL